ncbi:MAG: L,D-transpeptidase family protein [Prevotella sp.]
MKIIPARSIVIGIAACLGGVLLSCSDNKNPYDHLSLKTFDTLSINKCRISHDEVRHELLRLCRADNDTTPTDSKTRRFYRNGGELLWVDRMGVDPRVDTLLSHLGNVGNFGFTAKSFYVQLIADDVKRVRTLDFDDSKNSISKVLARMEYRLTKAYLRYVAGQRYGYVSPYMAFNALDLIDTTATRRNLGYRRLYDAKTLRPDSAFYTEAFNRVRNHNIGQFLAESKPRSEEYAELEKMLAETTDEKRRRLIICNMERARWYNPELPKSEDGRSVVVNIPAFHLYAFCADSTVSMRIGCGTRHTKTPLLSSMIERVDYNPEWNIPMSIIRHDVARHAGNQEWFDHRNYYIAERKTGKRIPASHVTHDMLLSGDYRVAQLGGEGNSLGRIIFRFPNDFAVYLHDTSSRGFFTRNYRGVSHGCVRVERPFDLGRFMVGDIATKWEADTTRVTRSRKVSPRVPIYIIYKTLFKTPEGKWETYPDVYGYDEIIYRRIKPFMH